MSQRTKRKAFTTLHDAIQVPDLIRVQKDSYSWFLQDGLKELFAEVSPITDYIGRDLELTFEDFFFDEPKFDVPTAKDRNVSFEAALRVRARLVNKRTGEMKEQEVYLGDFPMMTERGTFIINGIERVIVSQLVRSPGVFFSAEREQGKQYFGAKIIPNRGAWLEFETDDKGVIWVRIDRKRKIAATALLRAFGYSADEEIRALFAGRVAPIYDEIEQTINKDSTKSMAEGLIEVYRRIRPGDLATVDNAKSLIYAMFFNFDRYDVSRVGRYKMNVLFSEQLPLDVEHRTLRPEDIVATMREIMLRNRDQREPDDIDHLANRRLRSVGELVQNKVRIGLARMERIVVDRMSTLDIGHLTPNQLINNRPIMGVVKEFFMSSQLSQFMDQINPLAELEHKRRLSAMGPGGLSRERAGFEVRDVHHTHYSRICPIATPEGANIGLVGHLASYARLNDFGFIEAPYVKVELDKTTGKPRVTDEVIWLDALQEEKLVTTPATTPIDEHGYFINEKAEVRAYGRPGFEPVEKVNAMDVSPKQIVSVATALIPFLEHDDATRALMGSNMQRQAVNLVKPEAPLVGTGMEAKAAEDSGYLVLAPEDGIVSVVEGNEVQFTGKSGVTQRYPLQKFVRSNASTCINQRPTVVTGQKVKKGEILAEGVSIQGGELALGQNVLIAFMPWEGGNYEDAILVSERLVEQDRYTSIYIEDYTIDVRETKLGQELVTRDIPNVSEEKLKNLDEEGIIRIGAEVSSGDILVGKITPKGETELSAEEKLLRAIFGEKAKDVRDSSLYLEHGEHGKVVAVKIFSRENGDKLPAGVIKSIQVTIANLRKIQVGDKMAGRHGNKGVISRVVAMADMPHLADGTPVDIILNPLGIASRMNIGQVLETHLGMAAQALDYKVMSPVLDGVSESTIKDELKRAGFPDSGKQILYNGKTGKPFDQPTTVGIMYMLKLNHMVEDKIHQRSIGPYSLVTQQPLGGKAQFGGQRFGEMEVWALEAYGAAHILQEMLTIKSDDVIGRSRTYESIIKGEKIEKVHLPESFNVLMRELKSLGLEVELLDEHGDAKQWREPSEEQDRGSRRPRYTEEIIEIPPEEPVEKEVGV